MDNNFKYFMIKQLIFYHTVQLVKLKFIFCIITGVIFNENKIKINFTIAEKNMFIYVF